MLILDFEWESGMTFKGEQACCNSGAKNIHIDDLSEVTAMCKGLRDA